MIPKNLITALRGDNTYQDILGLCAGLEFYHFVIYDINFNSCEPDPKLQVKLEFKGYEVEIEFSEVQYHSAMSESYVYFYDKDKWDEDIFLAKAKESQLIKHLSEYTLFSGMNMDDLSDMVHYRVFAQNFFVDVITTSLPTFSYKMIDMISEV